MPIRALDCEGLAVTGGPAILIWNAVAVVLQEKKLIKEAPLSCLANTRLGIDASLYVRRLLGSSETKEPFVPAMGGVPLAIEEHIQDDMRVLEQHRIKPILVFSGLQPQRKERPLSTEDNRPNKRLQGWEFYEKGKNDLAVQAFGQVPIPVADVLRVVHRIMFRRKTELIVAPYLAWAQLVYLERSPKTYVHATWSSTEFLMFEGVDKLILNVDFKKATFTFMSKRDLLNELALGTEAFTDMSILAGCEVTPSIPLQEWSFRGCLELMRRFGNGPAAILGATQENPAVSQQHYMETFQRAKAMFQYSLVLCADEGRVLPLPLAIPPPANMPPLTNADIPIDLADVFSHRLPDELYFHLFRGLISPQTIGALTSGYWVEQAPLCGGESEPYRKFASELMTTHQQSPRCMALALLSACLHPFWQKRSVTAVFWYNPAGGIDIPHNHQHVRKSLDRLANWNVPTPVLVDELRRQASTTIDIRLCLGATATELKYAERTKIPKNPNRPLEKKDEIVANTLWRFLEIRGFLTAEHHQPSAHGKALHGALQKSRINDKFQDPLFLAIELIRAGVLHNQPYGKEVSGGPTLGGKTDRENSNLVMRVLSILPLNFKLEAWSGPVSRSLLVFNSFLRTLTRSLRVLLEATTVNMLLKGDAKRAREDYLDIALSLPFARDTNTGMGVLWKSWCDGCAKLGEMSELGDHLGGFVPEPEGMSPEDAAARKDDLESIKQMLAEQLEDVFKCIKDVRADLARGVRFWDTVMQAVRILHQERSMPTDIYHQYEDAHRWLEPFRP